MKKLIILGLVFNILGCSNLAGNLVTPLINLSDIPNVGVTYIAENNSLLWEYNSHLNSSEKSLEEYNWHVIHTGLSNNWQWSIYSTTLLSDNNNDVSIFDGEDWDNNLRLLSLYSQYLLDRPEPLTLSIYLLPEKEFKLSSEKSVNKIIDIPIVLSLDEVTGRSLPKNINDRVDLLAEIGEQVQMAYYELGKLPMPDEDDSQFLKKYANANCWRVAIRPALMMKSNNLVKQSPMIPNAVLSAFKNAFAGNPKNIKVAQLYSASLLLKNVNDHLTESNLDWPMSGKDEVEINTLLSFCKNYINNSKDPRV